MWFGFAWERWCFGCVLGDVATLSTAADDEGVGLEGHGAEELLAGAFDEGAGHFACFGVEFGVTKKAG